jgi:hypothetical protein
LPSALDFEPGAITVDVESSSSDPTRVWFVTRQGDARLFQFTPGRGRRDATAQWRSWSLDLQPGGATTGGLKKVRPSKDKRSVFVRTANSLQQVDPQCKPTIDVTGASICEEGLTVYQDRLPFFFFGTSDVAIDDFNNVYTAAPPDDFLPDAPVADLLGEYIQKLNPKAADIENQNPTSMTVTRWHVGGGAGVCPAMSELSEFSPCLAGIDLDDKNQHLVYYSASRDDAIGELNTKLTGDVNNVRYWSLAELSLKLKQDIRDPRQLKVEHENGKTVVWVVTGSGHVVRLIPQSGKSVLMSAHRMPDVENDPFGVAPDGRAIGYTAVSDPIVDASLDLRKDKVGMVLPKDTLVSVTTRERRAERSFPEIIVVRTVTETRTGYVSPDKKTAPGRVVRNEQGDTFVDAFIDEAPQPPGKLESMRPLGITPDHGSKVGTFFYAVGVSGNLEEPLEINRIGLAVLPQAERPKHARDDDDFDGDGKKNRHEDDDDDDDGTPNHMDRDNDNDCRDDVLDDDDDDNDGNEDKWDDPRKKETRDSRDHTTGPGAVTAHQVVVTAGTTLLVAQARASSLATPLRVEIVGPTGVKLASPLPTPGVAFATVVPLSAGTYTVRVTNLGLSAASLTTDLILQELWPALALIVP